MAAKKPPLIVIAGPTASGKSELAVRLAKKFNGEVISADSRQVYRGLDIGTGKITKRKMQGIPHHLLGVADPNYPFSAVRFQRLAGRAIRNIARRGKLPFVVGGTGFWIDALVRGLALPAVPPNLRLRKVLAAKSPGELLATLRRLDPDRVKSVEPKNPRRLIRAIEIAKTLGRVPKVKMRLPYHALWIGLRPPKAVLAKRVRQRARSMIRRGLVAETEKLIREGVSRARLSEFGFEYRTALERIAGRRSPAELEDRLARDTLGYARRQMRWFKRNPEIRWVKGAREAAALAGRFLAHP